MTELQILFQLEKFYGKVLSLEQSLEILGRVVFTMETLDQEGHDYDKIELIKEVTDDVMSEI